MIIEKNNKVPKGIIFGDLKSFYYPLKKGSITKEFIEDLKSKNSSFSMKEIIEKIIKEVKCKK